MNELLKEVLKVTSHAFVGSTMFLLGNEAAKETAADLWIVFGICFILFIVSLVIALVAAYSD